MERLTSTLREKMPRSIFVFACLSIAVTLSFSVNSSPSSEVNADDLAQFNKTVAPVLSQHCIRCHSAEEKKGGVSFEQNPATMVKDQELWLKALKMIRADMMPPKGRKRPTQEQIGDV